MTLRGTPTSSPSSTSDWTWDKEPHAQQLAGDYAELRPANPTWSPSGTEIAFLGTDDQNDRRLYVLETDGDTPEEMASDPGGPIQEPGPGRLGQPVSAGIRYTHETPRQHSAA